ncbi:hypothetical protein KY290_017302 [Solanum tuberosum]|uniref:Uncharacterized protein n=1 Tax=Solanum tuberosum TaxID=4113 RepID=A0ABQ7VCG2_SOLTU|nr:hypothetical protein KY284_016321 [Solanum tuberosum]KAH0702048.1 hypothetical protein KY285_016326 [Solanum tuberosum]KAH0761229.1 hypothetical protein KY290_017302 [Solanum tuberosum]
MEGKVIDLLNSTDQEARCVVQLKELELMDENNSNLGVHKGGCKLLVYERRNREPHRGNEGEKKWRSVGGGKWVKYDYNQARGNAGGILIL